MKLTPNFTLDEMTASDTAARFGIDNEPNEAEVRQLILLCDEILEPLRRKVGPIRVTSGFRSLALNRKIGSKDTSEHVQGRAADIRVNGISPLELCLTISDMGLPFNQLIHEFGSWCHVSIPADGKLPRKQLLTIDAKGTRAGLLPVRK